MEKTKKSKKKSGPVSAERIQQAYLNYLLTEGRSPASIYKFCLDLGIKEDEFYDHFGSFEAIEKYIWRGFVSDTIASLNSDAAYAAFSAREKVLTFYFALAEKLKSSRSFVLMQVANWTSPSALPPAPLREMKKDFDPWVKGVVEQAKQSGEIAKRPYIDKQYHTLLWLHFLFILHFWTKDDSPGFEKTDAAIEKSVNLAFELIGKGVLDQAVDFGKFLFQQVKD